MQLKEIDEEFFKEWFEVLPEQYLDEFVQSDLEKTAVLDRIGETFKQYQEREFTHLLQLAGGSIHLQRVGHINYVRWPAHNDEGILTDSQVKAALLGSYFDVGYRFVTMSEGLELLQRESGFGELQEI